MQRRTMILGAAGAAALSSLPFQAALASSFPEKEVKLIVPFKPGGATDIIYRVTSEAAVKTFGKPIVIVNMGGAGGSKGARFVKGAPPDGYTALAGHDFLFTTYYGKLSNFQYTAFEPVCLLTQTPNIIVARPGLPFRDFHGLVEYLKKNPGKLTVTYSPASTGTLFFKQVFALAGVPESAARVVTINGTGPQIRAVLGGNVDIAMGNVPSALSFAKEKKLVMLAASSEKRLEACPEVPTLKELGVNFTFATNRGVFLPKGAPAEAVEKLAAAYRSALADPGVQKKIRDLGSIPEYKKPRDYAEFLKGQDRLYRESFK